MQNNCLDLKTKEKKKEKSVFSQVIYNTVQKNRKKNTKLDYYIKVIYNSLQIKEKKNMYGLQAIHKGSSAFQRLGRVNRGI